MEYHADFFDAVLILHPERVQMIYTTHEKYENTSHHDTSEATRTVHKESKSAI